MELIFSCFDLTLSAEDDCDSGEKICTFDDALLLEDFGDSSEGHSLLDEDYFVQRPARRRNKEKPTENQNKKEENPE